MTIKWGRSEDGYLTSKCGRFKITPIFAGRCNPIWYEVEDLNYSGFGKTTRSTQRDCKQWIEDQLNPPSDSLKWPTRITDDML